MELEQEQTIQGLPPGAILKPIEQPAIADLPAGAILKPIQGASAPKEPPAETMTPAQQMERAKSRTYSGTSMGPSESTFAQTHPIYQKLFGASLGAAKRFAAGAGIPTSQGETTDAVQGMLTPQADPAEQDNLLRIEEKIPILGGDFRARADLAKKGDTRNAAIPFFGPANAAFAEKASKGDYAGAAGSALNAILSLEGLKGAVKPKAGPVEGLRSPSEPAINQPALPPKQPGTYTGPSVSGPPGVVAKTSAAATSKLLGGGPEAMQKAPIKQATAAGEATNAQVRNYAASKGIDLLPGQATQARGLQTIQAVGERAVVAPGDLLEVLEKQKAAFGNAIDDFKQRVGTEAIPDTEAAGTSLKSQAQHGLNTLKDSAHADYQGFQQKAGDIPVDLSDVKAKAQAAMASQAEALRNVPAKYANPVRNVLGKLSDLEAGPAVNPKVMADFQSAVEQYGFGPEQQAQLREKMGIPAEGAQAGFTMSTAQQLRSAYLDISRDYSGNVPKSVQRYAGQAAKDIDAAMAKAADSVGATEQWRQANSKWKQLQETYNNPEHPLYKVLQEPDAVKVPSRLLGKGSYGGSPNTVRQLQAAGIDVSPLKREVAQQIADKNFALTNGGRGLAGYSTEFLKTLYTPSEFQELTTMGRVGRAIKFEMNPSGTSNVMEGHRQIHGIIHRTAGAVVGPIASRITTSKALARATMGDVGPVAQPHSLADILGSKPPAPPPEAPPATGAPREPNPAPPATPKAQGMAAQPRSLSSILSGQVERRSASGADLRATLDAAKAKMSPDESTNAIFTDEKSGLPNRKAFNIAQQSMADSHPHVGFADIDDFKNINSKLGEPAVDQTVFPAIGEAMRNAVAKENGGVHAFHVHGDEFQFLGSHPDIISRAVDNVNAELSKAKFTVQKADGTISEVPGVGFSHGTGTTLEAANAAEKLNKQVRKDAGLRSGTRDAPQNTIAQVASGKQAPVNQNAQRQSVRRAANPNVDQQSSVAQPSLSDIFSGKQSTDSYAQAKQLVAEFGKSSSSLLQRRLKIGYAEAVKYQDRMFKDGLVDRAGNGATWKGGK